ncbi:SMP-30/gluconolactonase/LRE family protein [Trinickia violacea]|nr:SMP-30/gluconolactonase/LRE family protein [Trinickia violacea]
MSNPFMNLADRFFGRGQYAVTIPAMDGPLLPNSLLDAAHLVEQIAEPDNLAVLGDRTYFTSGRCVYRLNNGSQKAERVEEFPAEITALAARSDGRFAACLSNGSVAVWEEGRKPQTIHDLSKRRLTCLTSVAHGNGDEIYVTNGSLSNGPKGWAKDLLEKNASGSVWRLDAGNGSCTELAKGLGFPAGVMADGGQLVVSEAWRHQLLSIDLAATQRPRAILADLPAYPSRIVKATDGYWLCLFAPRSQLIEFVLREEAYRRRMMEEVAPQFWIAPALRSGDSFLEPLQGGGVKRMGILKPWAPTRSYGLVVKLDRTFQVLESFHSRADGVRHGITSVVEINGSAIVTSKGGNAILAFDAPRTRENRNAARH